MKLLTKLQLKWIQLRCKHIWISPWVEDFRSRERKCTECDKREYPFKNIK